jgi:DmsE family decaheme c-type cytochrome
MIKEIVHKLRTCLQFSLRGIWILLLFCAGSRDLRCAADQPSGYVGSTVCKACHPDVWLNFYRNPHYKSIASGKEKPEDTGCESCHGPGKGHLLAHGGKESIIAFPELKPGAVLDSCLRCHASSLNRANIRRSEHTLNGVVCTQCHSIHKAETPRFLLAKSQPEACYGCHAEVRADFSMPFKHRVNEGYMVCTDCHNPHGTYAPTWRMASRPHLVPQALANEEPCLKCHSEKRGPFAFEHPPVRVEGCEVCHNPHGSTNSRLLRRPVVFTMCLECHNGAAPFGRQGDGIQPLSAAHNMTDPRYQNCTNCHVRIHGSNSDPLFLR